MYRFQPNCTVQPLRHGSQGYYIDGPNVRGTLNILWNCLAVFFLCTWTIQHLNIPEQAPSDATSDWITKKLLGFGRKSKWMLITVIAPEFILAKAWLDLLAAQRNCKEMKPFAAEDGVEWTKAHAYYANMGGFVIEFGPIQAQSATSVERPQIMVISSTVKQSQVDPSSQETTDEVSIRSRQNDTQTRFQNGETVSTGNSTSPSGHGSYYHLVEKAKKDQKPGRRWDSGRDTYRALSRLANDTWVLDASQLLKARKIGIISKLPEVTEAEIMDQSKSDIPAKTLAVLQISWLVFQLITRAFKHLASTQLEIAALAFGISAIITNGLLYKKPQDVEVTRLILATRRPQSTGELIDIALEGPYYPFYHSESARTGIPNNSIHTSFHTFVNIMVLGGGVFGAIHCIAWNFIFPTFVEQFLWQMMSLLWIAVILLWATSHGFLAICYALAAWSPGMQINLGLNLEEAAPIQDQLLWVPFDYAHFFFNSLTRIFLTVEMFRALAFAPPETFIAIFTTSLPTIG